MNRFETDSEGKSFNMKNYFVVVLYNSSDAIRCLWQCLLLQTTSDWRLIVIDNGGSGDAGAFLIGQSDSRVTLLVNSENLGFGRAANQGLRLALAQEADRVILLNPDVTFDPDFLAEMLSQWTHLQADVIAPRIMYLNNPEKAWYAGGNLDYGWIFSNSHNDYSVDGPSTKIVDFATGCCLGLTRSILQTVGLFDERFFVYWEDVDLCIRLKAIGTAIHYVAQPMLFHEVGGSTDGDRGPAGFRLYYKSYAQLIKKHFGQRRAVMTMVRVSMREFNRSGQIPGHGQRVFQSLVQGFLASVPPKSLR